jgi:Phage integrase central domain
MNGSIRQRSAGSWELRVYIGTDPVTGRRLDRSVTVRGKRDDATRELAEMVASTRAVRAVGRRSSVSELLERWFAVASAGWAPTTISQSRSVLDRYLHPHLGAVLVGDVTAAMIDATYAALRRHGGVGGRPLAAGTLVRVHVVLRSAFPQGDALGMDLGQPRRTGPSARHSQPRNAPTDPRGAAHPPRLRRCARLPVARSARARSVHRRPPRPAARTALAQRSSRRQACLVLRWIGSRDPMGPY